MVEFRTDKEVLQIMGNCVDFVCELIDYIAEYPDDDYMTMECLCRKLVKYDLIDKKDGYYLVADGIKADRKTEPQYEMGMGTLKCDNCSENGSYKCTKCDGEMYFKRLEPKDEPQTEICLYCEHYEPKGYCKLKECSVSPNHKCDEYLVIEPYEVKIISKSHERIDGAKAIIEDEPQTEREGE